MNRSRKMQKNALVCCKTMSLITDVIFSTFRLSYLLKATTFCPVIVNKKAKVYGEVRL